MSLQRLLVRFLVLVIGIFYLSARLEVQPEQTGKHLDTEVHVASQLALTFPAPVVSEPPAPPAAVALPVVVAGLVAVVYRLRAHTARVEHPPPNLPLYNRLFLRHSVFRL